jgi:hypothetical protein
MIGPVNNAPSAGSFRVFWRPDNLSVVQDPEELLDGLILISAAGSRY